MSVFQLWTIFAYNYIQKCAHTRVKSDKRLNKQLCKCKCFLKLPMNDTEPFILRPHFWKSVEKWF